MTAAPFAVLTGLRAVFSFLLFPAFTSFTNTVLKFVFGCGGYALGVLCDFVSSFASLERHRVSVALLSLTLGISLPFIGARTSAHGESSKYYEEASAASHISSILGRPALANGSAAHRRVRIGCHLVRP
jgi:hypothetical protein